MWKKKKKKKMEFSNLASRRSQSQNFKDPLAFQMHSFFKHLSQNELTYEINQQNLFTFIFSFASDNILLNAH